MPGSPVRVAARLNRRPPRRLGRRRGARGRARAPASRSWNASGVDPPRGAVERLTAGRRRRGRRGERSAAGRRHADGPGRGTDGRVPRRRFAGRPRRRNEWPPATRGRGPRGRMGRGAGRPPAQRACSIRGRARTMAGTANPGGPATDGAATCDAARRHRHRDVGDPRRRNAGASGPARGAGRHRGCRPSRRGGAPHPLRERGGPCRGADHPRRPRARGPRRPLAETWQRNAMRLRSELAGTVVAEAASRRPSPSSMPRMPRTESDWRTPRRRHPGPRTPALRRRADPRRRSRRAGGPLGLDALRESVLVDLAGLGEPGLAHLAAVSGMALVPSPAPVVEAAVTLMST